jgi:hypothetical protein
MGAPGLAFETWDPSNQFPLEAPTFLFVIRSAAEGPAVRLRPPQSVQQPLSITRNPPLVIPTGAEGSAVFLHPSPIQRKTLPLKLFLDMY